MNTGNQKLFYLLLIKGGLILLIIFISLSSGNSVPHTKSPTLAKAAPYKTIPGDITHILACDDTSYTQQKAICNGDSIMVGNSVYDSAGTYKDSLTTDGGCDSIITTELTVHPTYYIRDTVTVCPGDSAEIFGAWRDSSRTYYDSLTTQSTNCDSIRSIYLNHYPEYHTDTCSIISEGDSLKIHGTWRATPGTYIDSSISTNGCDSISKHTLYTGPQINMGPDTIQACQGDSLFFELSGNNNIVEYTWTNSIKYSYDSTFSFNFKEDGNSNVVNVATTLEGGCLAYDTTYVIDSTLRNVEQQLPFVTDPVATFQIKNLPEGTKHWYWSFGDGDTLAGETLPVHKYRKNGTYKACLIGVNKCNKDSSCFSITISEAVTGLRSPLASQDVTISPNPSPQKITVSWPERLKRTDIRIYDPLGRKIRQRSVSGKQKTTFNFNQQSGVYIVEVSTSGEVVQKKVLIR